MLELPGVGLGQLGHVPGADVEQGVEGQGQGVPQRVTGQPGKGDPEVAVDVLLAGRAGRGVVVDAGALDARAVTGRGRVVDGEEPVVARQQPQERAQGAAEQAVG